MKSRAAIICAVAAALLIAPSADAALTKKTPSYVHTFTGTPGIVAVENAGLGQYVWYAEAFGGPNTILNRFEHSGGATAPIAPEFVRAYTDPEYEIGTVTDVLYDPNTNLIFLTDNTYNRILWYERNGAAPPADPVDYGSVDQMPQPLGPVSTGSGNGEFDNIGTMVLFTDGSQRQLAVADRGNARVQVFDVDASGLTHAFNIAMPGGVEPLSVADDSGRGELWVSASNGNAIEVFDYDGNYVDGFTPVPNTGTYYELEYNENEHVMYASNTANLDVFSTDSFARLGTYSFTQISEPDPPGPDNGNRMFLSFALSPSSSDIYVTRYNPNAPVEPDDPEPAQVYATAVWPTCDVSTPVVVEPGSTTTVTPACTDADGAPRKEFQVTGQPSAGTANTFVDLSGFEYTAPAEPGSTSIPFVVTTMNGRSQPYQLQVIVSAPAEPPAPTPQSAPTYRTDSNLSRSTGQIMIQLPGTSTFVPLEKDAVVPLGTIVDATKGVAVVTWARPDGSTYNAKFWAGVFEIRQTTGKDPIGVVQLRDELVKRAAGARATTAAGIASASAQFEAWIAKKKKKGKRKNKVWGDGKGKFRSTGNNSSASVRGTVWLVENYANATRTFVKKGIVDVRDLRKKKTIRLRKGKSYIAYRR